MPIANSLPAPTEALYDRSLAGETDSPGQSLSRLWTDWREVVILAEVVAIEPEPDMLADGESRAAIADVGNVKFVAGSSDSLPAGTAVVSWLVPRRVDGTVISLDGR